MQVRKQATLLFLLLLTFTLHSIEAAPTPSKDDVAQNLQTRGLFTAAARVAPELEPLTLDVIEADGKWLITSPKAAELFGSSPSYAFPARNQKLIVGDLKITTDKHGWVRLKNNGLGYQHVQIIPPRSTSLSVYLVYPGTTESFAPETLVGHSLKAAQVPHRSVTYSYE